MDPIRKTSTMTSTNSFAILSWTCRARRNRAPTKMSSTGRETESTAGRILLFKIEMRRGEAPAYLANHLRHPHNRGCPRPRPLPAATAEAQIRRKQTAIG
jgi:hypothetical protein